MVPVWGNVVARVEGIPHLLFAGWQEDAVIGAFAIDEVGPPGRPQRKCYVKCGTSTQLGEYSQVVADRHRSGGQFFAKVAANGFRT